MTRRIRMDLMKRQNLSVAAKNIKIITTKNRIELKGIVKSLSEENEIKELALFESHSRPIVSSLIIQQ